MEVRYCALNTFHNSHVVSVNHGDMGDICYECPGIWGGIG